MDTTISGFRSQDPWTRRREDDDVRAPPPAASRPAPPPRPHYLEPAAARGAKPVAPLVAAGTPDARDAQTKRGLDAFRMAMTGWYPTPGGDFAAGGPWRDPRPRLVAIDRDATVAGELPLDRMRSTPPTMAVKGGRLVVALGREMLEVSPALQVVAHHSGTIGGRLAVSADGRILSGEGDVLSDAFTLLRTVSAEPWVHEVLWVGATPVMVGSSAEVVRQGRIHWWE